MGKIAPPPKVKLFCGVLHTADFPWGEIYSRMQTQLGAIDGESAPMPFTFTDYYQDEMGPAVTRRFVAFRELVGPDVLPAVKTVTNRLEEELAAGGAAAFPRPVNLDPGYMELSKIVLASTKNFYHRLYLRDGIWGEVTLFFQSKRWQTLPWTFPDYRSEAYHVYFSELRGIYLDQLRGVP